MDVVGSGVQTDATTLQFRVQAGRASSIFTRISASGISSVSHYKVVVVHVCLFCFQVIVLHKIVRLEKEKIRRKLTKVDLPLHFLHKRQHLKATPLLQRRQQQQQLYYLV